MVESPTRMKRTGFALAVFATSAAWAAPAAVLSAKAAASSLMVMKSPDKKTAPAAVAGGRRMSWVRRGGQPITPAAHYTASEIVGRTQVVRTADRAGRAGQVAERVAAVVRHRRVRVEHVGDAEDQLQVLDALVAHRQVPRLVRVDVADRKSV